MAMAKLRPHRKLPMDIIESEILPRLPAKSVGRFMCVCKQWQSLLSTQDFRRKNHRHITTIEPRTHQKLILCYGSEGTFSTHDCGTTPSDISGRTTHHLPLVSGSRPARHAMLILASFDGLVCVTYVARSNTGQLMFWNPLTRSYWKSRSCVRSFDSIYADAFGLYSDSVNDYKLLRLVRLRDEYNPIDQPRVYIYSRRLDSWRQISSFKYTDYLYYPRYRWSTGVFAGQSLYFTVVSVVQSCIIGFDVMSEEFREIQLPGDVSGRGFNGSLVVMNGCIHLCVAHENNEREFYTPLMDHIDVWRMEGDGDGWMKVVVYSGNKDIPITLTPCCKVRHGKWDVTWVFYKAFQKVDVTTYQGYKQPSDATCFLYDLARAIYIETLVSPNP